MYEEREPDDQELTPELARLQRQLSCLTPAPLRLDRDGLMFEAGRAAGRAEPVVRRIEEGASWFWPAATATMTAASLLLAAMLVWQKEPRSVAQQAAKPQADVEEAAPAQVVEVVEANYVADDVQTTLWAPRATSGYLGLRHLALTKGVGALEPATLTANGHPSTTDAPTHRPATARDLLNELLPNEDLHARS